MAYITVTAEDSQEIAVIKNQIQTLIILSLIIFLIIFAPQTSAGARNGLLLWFNNVLPVLFPFSFLLQITMSSNNLSSISKYTGFLVHRLFRLSPSCSFCILAGFLCGFPMGAATASQALESRQITQDEAQLLSAVCNHASPMFLTGYILHQVLMDPPFQRFLILIFYISPFIWLWIRCFILHHFHPYSSLKEKRQTPARHDTASFRGALLNSSELMLKIGVCMMFFAIFQEIIRVFPLISPSAGAILALLLEITSGASAIGSLPWPNELKTILIMGAAAFGGLCISAQTYTILHAKKLSFMCYLADKSAVGIITAALVWLLYQVV